MFYMITLRSESLKDEILNWLTTQLEIREMSRKMRKNRKVREFEEMMKRHRKVGNSITLLYFQHILDVACNFFIVQLPLTL